MRKELEGWGEVHVRPQMRGVFSCPWFFNQTMGLVHRGQKSSCKPLLWGVAFSKVLAGQRLETFQEAPPEGVRTMLLTPNPT